MAQLELLRIAQVLLLLLGARAQQEGTVTPEESPAIVIERCDSQGCQKEHLNMVLDASWRWVHNVGGYENCFSANGFSDTFCPDEATCKEKCALEGVTADKYKDSYGVIPEDDGVTLKFMTEGGNVGSRLYLANLSDGQESYKMFKLLNREFTLDVDVSTLNCGTNGAVYFIEMDALGGKGKHGNNAGAKYGTGYCDAQCPHEKFVFGENAENKGICCVEMDIWEANMHATAFTPHPCNTTGPMRCEGTECGFDAERWNGWCDKDGCDLNAYRMGAKDFYGPTSDHKVDSSKPLTVVTQFLTDNGQDDGTLVEIRRLYLQGGKLIEHAASTVEGVEGSSVTDDFCNKQKETFGDINDHQEMGGLRSMGETLKRGMVLSLSIWDDYSTQMRWLDSTYPPEATVYEPGAQRGPCSGSTSHPTQVRETHHDAFVKYTNIKYGEIGTTFSEPTGRRLNSMHI